MDTLRISPYGRISEDFEKLELGVKRQLEDAIKLIQLRGAVPTEPYQDNHVSAYQPEVLRDDFERWLRDFREGYTDGIAAYDLDRVVRKPSDLERMIEVYDEATKRGRPTAFITVQGSIDLSTPDGRTMARVMVAFANKASMDTARRVARQKLDRATKGIGTSNYPAFGWNLDGTLNDKAKLLKEAIDQVFSGVKLPSIVVEWQQEGTKTERGKEWTSTALRRVLLSPRIAGLAFYRGEVLLDSNGKSIKGSWEPLIEEDRWKELVELVRPKMSPQRRSKGFLSGLARCGLCGTGMVRYARGKRFSYGCRSKDSGGCAAVSISGNRLDEQITELILTYLDSRETQPEAKPFPGQDRLAEISHKKKELMREYSAGLSGSLVFPAIRGLEEEEKALRSASAEHTSRQRRVTTTRQEWPTLPLGKRQAITRTLFEAIVIAPSGKTGLYNPNRATIVWKS